MTTLEAFTELCQDPERCIKAGMNDGTRRSYLTYLKNEKWISIKKMEEWLTAANFKVVQEKLWQK